MSKINVEDYGIDVSEFVTNQKGYPHCQLFNPQSDNYGLAINQEIAKQIDFKPDENWQLETVTLRDEKKKRFTGKMWFSRNPRMIILNGYQDALISNEIKVASAPLLMQEKESKQICYYKKKDFSKITHENYYRVLVIFFVDKENVLLSQSPLVFRTKGKAQSLIGLSYTEYVNESLKIFEKVTGVTLPKQTPTCKFTSRFVYSPILTAGELYGENGENSEATLVETYEKLTETNFSNLVLKNNDLTLLHIQSFLPQLKSYSHPPIDENGVVNRLSEEDMAILQSEGIEI